MTLTAGPELDREIAEAIGLEVRYNDLGECYVRVSDGEAWLPSRDLNHAWEAADAAGLWNGERGPRYVTGDDGFGTVCELMPDYEGGEHMGSIAFQDTAALAICAAIKEVVK